MYCAVPLAENAVPCFLLSPTHTFNSFSLTLHSNLHRNVRRRNFNELMQKLFIGTWTNLIFFDEPGLLSTHSFMHQFMLQASGRINKLFFGQVFVQILSFISLFFSSVL